MHEFDEAMIRLDRITSVTKKYIWQLAHARALVPSNYLDVLKMPDTLIKLAGHIIAEDICINP